MCLKMLSVDVPRGNDEIHICFTSIQHIVCRFKGNVAVKFYI